MAKARFTITAFVALLTATIERVREEHADDGILSPAECLDVLLGILSGIQSSLPSPIPSLISTMLGIGYGILNILGETPGPDHVAKAINKIEATQVKINMPDIVGTRMALTSPRTRRLSRSEQSNSSDRAD